MEECNPPICSEQRAAQFSKGSHLGPRHCQGTGDYQDEVADQNPWSDVKTWPFFYSEIKDQPLDRFLVSIERRQKR